MGGRGSGLGLGRPGGRVRWAVVRIVEEQRAR